MNHDHSENLESAIEIFSPSALILDDALGSMNGPILLTEVLIARTQNCKIHLYHKDHNYPHFHVLEGTESVGFSIKTGERLKGHKGLEKKDKLIKKYWEGDRCRLAEQWNKMRSENPQYEFITIPSDWSCEDTIRYEK